ncbi:hypothetical protein Btru_064571 [Bulinus truncatus]|nr:hypothetical protein Btru_064571 [Bulinus truncatus]
MTPYSPCRPPKGKDVCCPVGGPHHGSELDASSAYVITVLTHETTESTAAAATCYGAAEGEWPCHTRHNRIPESEPLRDFVYYDDHDSGWIRKSKRRDKMDYLQDSRCFAQEDSFHEEFQSSYALVCSESGARGSGEAYRAKEFYVLGSEMNPPYVVRENIERDAYTSDWCDSVDGTDPNRTNYADLCYNRSSCYSASPESPIGDRELEDGRSVNALADRDRNSRSGEYRGHPEASVYTDLDLHNRGRTRRSSDRDVGSPRKIWNGDIESTRGAVRRCDVGGQTEGKIYAHLERKYRRSKTPSPTGPRRAKEIYGSFNPNWPMRDSGDQPVDTEGADFADMSSFGYIPNNSRTEVFDGRQRVQHDDVMYTYVDNMHRQSNTLGQDGHRQSNALGQDGHRQSNTLGKDGHRQSNTLGQDGHRQSNTLGQDGHRQSNALGQDGHRQSNALGQDVHRQSNTLDQDVHRQGKFDQVKKNTFQEDIADASGQDSTDTDLCPADSDSIDETKSSKDNSCSSNPVLPPCRICGAKASGFHYGVNSCEACKGFFRRALKRPMVFHCTKNKTCDVKGSKRSTCRFCRYKRCLKLGMSKEAIKTGRYSHKKRTKDTIEVKRLLQGQGAVADASELDAVLSSIFLADQTRLKSAIPSPENTLLEKQREYAALYSTRKGRQKDNSSSLETVHVKELSLIDSRQMGHGDPTRVTSHTTAAHNTPGNGSDYCVSKQVESGQNKHFMGPLNEHNNTLLHMKDSQNVSYAQAGHERISSIKHSRRPIYETVCPDNVNNVSEDLVHLMDINNGLRSRKGHRRSAETYERDRSPCDRTPRDPASARTVNGSRTPSEAPHPSRQGETPNVDGGGRRPRSASRGSKTAVIAHAENWVTGYIGFARSLPGFSSLSSQDQASLLRNAWDEVWILGAYRGYNKDLDVVTMPSGQCFHIEEMEKGWGKEYTHMAFDIAEIIKRHNPSPPLITLLKAICIVSPDRCELKSRTEVESLHWAVVTYLLHYLQTHHPEDRGLLPRLVDFMTSLRGISETAQHRQEVTGAADPLNSSMLTNMFAPF